MCGIYKSNAMNCLILLYSIIWHHIAPYCIILYCNTILRSNVFTVVFSIALYYNLMMQYVAYYIMLHLTIPFVFLCIVIFFVYCNVPHVLLYYFTAVLTKSINYFIVLYCSMTNTVFLMYDSDVTWCMC